MPPAPMPRKKRLSCSRCSGWAAVAAAGGIFYATHQVAGDSQPIVAPAAPIAPTSGVRDRHVTAVPDRHRPAIPWSSRSRASPTSAQIFVDDALVDGNPFRGRFPKSGGTLHTVKVVAPGFLSKSEIVKLDANNNMTFSLERHNVAVWTPPPTPAPPRAPEPAHVAPAAPAPARESASAAPAKTVDINMKGGKAPQT